MEILVYYSHNHKCFKTRFQPCFPTESDIGYINGFNEELMLITVSRGFNLSIRNRFIKFLKNVINRLENPVYSCNKYRKRRRLYKSNNH